MIIPAHTVGNRAIGFYNALMDFPVRAIDWIMTGWVAEDLDPRVRRLANRITSRREGADTDDYGKYGARVIVPLPEGKEKSWYVKLDGERAKAYYEGIFPSLERRG